MEFVVIAFGAGIAVGAIGLWVAFPWIAARKYQLSERAVDPKQPLRDHFGLEPEDGTAVVVDVLAGGNEAFKASVKAFDESCKSLSVTGT